jgi:hypothetical protein
MTTIERQLLHKRRHLDHAGEAWSSAYVQLPASARALLHVLASFPDAVLWEDLEAAYAAIGPALGARHPFDPTLRMLSDEFVRIEQPDDTAVTVRLRDAGLEAFMAKQFERDNVAARAVLESAGFFEQATHVWRLITRRGRCTSLDGVFAGAAGRLLHGPSFAWRSRPEWPSTEARLSVLVALASGPGAPDGLAEIIERELRVPVERS